jgi:hypothetical protein
MSAEKGQPISLAQRSAWQQTWRWLLAPLDSEPEEEPAPEPIRPPEPLHLDEQLAG